MARPGKTALKGGLHLQGAEVEAIWRHRAGMMVGLTPADAEAKEHKGSPG